MGTFEILANELAISSQTFSKNITFRPNRMAEKRALNYHTSLLPSFGVWQQQRLLTETYHERPLLDFVHDDGASLGHPGQQYSDSSNRQPADIQATGRCIQLVDFGASCPEGHQPAPGEH